MAGLIMITKNRWLNTLLLWKKTYILIIVGFLGLPCCSPLTGSSTSILYGQKILVRVPGARSCKYSLIHVALWILIIAFVLQPSNSCCFCLIFPFISCHAPSRPSVNTVVIDRHSLAHINPLNSFAKYAVVRRVLAPLPTLWVKRPRISASSKTTLPYGYCPGIRTGCDLKWVHVHHLMHEA